jgi:hypothetical protein
MSKIIALAFAFLCGLNWACVHKNRSNGTPPNPEPEKEDLTKPLLDQAPPDWSEANYKQGAICAKAPVETGLEAHLFSIAEVCSLKPLVLPKAGNAVPQVPLAWQLDPGYRDWMNFAEDFVNQGMQHSALQPGRQFKVFVIQDESENASARGNLIFNNGLLKVASERSAAFILCHEAAHEARNHGVSTERAFEKLLAREDSLALRFGSLYQSYLDQQFKDEVYTHSKRTFDTLKDVWLELTAEVSAISRRNESEADIAGFKICTEFGFTLEELIDGYFAFFEPKIDSPSEPQIEETSYPLKGVEPATFLAELLMAHVKSHPTPKERILQQKRLFPSYTDAASTVVADTWRSGYRSHVSLSLLANMGQSSLNKDLMAYKQAVAQFQGVTGAMQSHGCSFASQTLTKFFEKIPKN